MRTAPLGICREQALHFTDGKKKERDGVEHGENATQKRSEKHYLRTSALGVLDAAREVAAATPARGSSSGRELESCRLRGPPRGRPKGDLRGVHRLAWRYSSG
jgi:hypothetical protein